MTNTLAIAAIPAPAPAPPSGWAQLVPEGLESDWFLDRGQRMLAQGTVASRLFAVQSGVLIRHRTLPDNRRQIVNFLFPGDLVGLQGVFGDRLRHSVEVLLDARLRVVPYDAFFALIDERPALRRQLIRLTVREEQELEDHIVALGQRTAKERVAYLAVWLMDRALATGVIAAPGGRAYNFAIPITQIQIGETLGLSQVHVNRTLRWLREAGLLDWRPGAIEIADLDRAREFAQLSR